MEAYHAEAWADFSVAVAGAGAALAGLLFVALSINLDRILAGEHLTTRAAHALLLLAAPLVISLLLLIPGQRPAALGAELTVSGVAAGAVLAWLNRPGLRAPEQPLAGWVAGSAAPAALLTLSAVVAGLTTMTQTAGGLYWLPVGVIAAFIGALLTAWALLIEILR